MCRFIILLLIAFAIIVFETKVTSAVGGMPSNDADFDFQRIMPLNDTNNKPITFHLKPARYNKTVYVINGNLSLADDIRTYDVSVKLYHSPKGNNQYNLAPFKIDRKPFCEIYNKEYRKFLMESLKEPASDLPYTEDPSVDLCDIVENNKNHIYKLKNYTFDKNTLPKLWEDGLYKLIIFFHNGDEVMSGIVVLLKITNI